MLGHRSLLFLYTCLFCEFPTAIGGDGGVGGKDDGVGGRGADIGRDR